VRLLREVEGPEPEDEGCEQLGAGERHSRELCEEIARAEERKLRARRRGEQSAWFGLGTFGLVGWSVAVPTVLGVLLGMWLDRTWPGPTSWTLTMLFAGIVVGCINAWYWISRERSEIEEEIEAGKRPREDSDE